MGNKGVIAFLSCAFALCLALAGCGGDSAEANKAAFEGTWDLVEMTQGDQVWGADDLNVLKDSGVEVFVNLNEDGTSSLVLPYNDVYSGTWEATSATEGAITMQDEVLNMTISDSKLTFEQDESKLTFEKGEAKEVPAAADATEGIAVDDETAAEEEADEATAEDATDEVAETADEAAPADETVESADGGAQSSSSSEA